MPIHLFAFSSPSATGETLPLVACSGLYRELLACIDLEGLGCRVFDFLRC